MQSAQGGPGPGVSSPLSRSGLDRDRLEQLLAFGFVPDTDVDDPLSLLAAWSRGAQPGSVHGTEEALLRRGAAALRAAVTQTAAHPGRGEHVVFLSGGLDSRAILGELSNLVDRSRILAATFGRPGQPDFDYAVAVARAAGVRHTTLDPLDVAWTTDGLVDSVLARGVPTPRPVGQRYLSWLLHQRIGPANVFWDGLCGDAVGGKKSPAAGGDWTWGSALDHFLAFHLKPGWDRLSAPGFDPRAVLPDTPFCPPDELGYFDQLVFGVRQRCYTGTRLLRDLDIRTPFLAGPWLDFMLGVPGRFRVDQYLYRQILAHEHPRLYSLPVTALDGGALTESRGARLRRETCQRAVRKAERLGLHKPVVTPDTGTVNTGIHARLQQPGALRDLARENIADLRDRGVVDWVDVGRYQPDADAGTPCDTRVVVRLVDLEINLKAADRLAGDPADSDG